MYSVVLIYLKSILLSDLLVPMCLRAHIAQASQETISVACCLINQSPFRTPAHHLH